MSFEKTNNIDSNSILRNWCTCTPCDNDSPPHAEYNKRSGPENPKQNGITYKHYLEKILLQINLQIQWIQIYNFHYHNMCL